MATGLPRVKADLTSAFLIASDQGDKTGQPVMMKPPKEWLEDYEELYLLQPKEVQEELKDVPKEHLLWQVDGNLYGRQSAAAQYRDRLEEIITKCLCRRDSNLLFVQRFSVVAVQRQEASLTQCILPDKVWRKNSRNGQMSNVGEQHGC